MSKIIAMHSFRGGTGKTNLTANLAALAVRSGLRVGMVDTDIQSPGIHVLFGWDPGAARQTLNDYLWGDCAIEAAAYPVAEALLGPGLFLIPSHLSTGAITRVLREGYDVGRLNEGFRTLLRALNLDLLLVDTHPGLNHETLLSVAVSDVMVVLLRPDRQDYQGTSVTVEVAKRLEVPELWLVANKVPPGLDLTVVERQIAETFDCPVLGVLPHSDALMALSSAGLFVLERPDDPLTDRLRRMADRLLRREIAAGVGAGAGAGA